MTKKQKRNRFQVASSFRRSMLREPTYFSSTMIDKNPLRLSPKQNRKNCFCVD